MSENIDVRNVTDNERDDWNRCIDQSPHATPFHRFEALEILESYSDTELHPLLGYNGAEPIGVFPVFETQSGASTVIRSPPHLLESLPLGPALAGLGGMSTRKADRYRASFVSNCLDHVEERIAPDLVHVRTPVGYDDARPFRWSGLEVEPFFTYVVDLTPGPEEIMAGFSRDARSNIRGADESRYAIEAGDVADVEFIFEQLRERHAEQDKEYRIVPGFMPALFETLDDVRAYVCTVDGERASGLITLESDDVIYRWQGGARTDVDLPTSDLLDWHVMRDAAERGVAGYDLVGANDRRLCAYKSKFGPELRTYYNVRQRGGLNAVATDLRRTFNTVRDVLGETDLPVRSR